MQLLKVSVALASVLSYVTGQSISFANVYAVKPELRSAHQISTLTTDRHSAASSILSRLSSSHVATMTSASASVTKSSTTKKSSSARTIKKSSAAKRSSSSTKKVKTSSKKLASTKTISKSKSKSEAHEVQRRQATSSVNPSACVTPAIVQYGYQPNPNTPSGFLADTNLSSLAISNIAGPAGYTLVAGNGLASLQSQNYMGFWELLSYNVSACSVLCDANAGCLSFNIYTERSPLSVPDSECQNPAAAAAVKCALWGSYANSTQLLNIGQWRTNFMVVVSSSNVYTQNTAPASVPAFQPPTALYGAINQSDPISAHTFRGYQFFATYTPSLCSAFCLSYTQSARSAAAAAGNSTYRTCSYFNTFNLTLNGASQGMYCQIFNSPAVSTKASLTYLLQANVTYNITYSYGYTVTNPDFGLTAACGNASTTFMDSNGVYYTVGCGVSLGAVTIGSAAASSFNACFGLCDAMANCTGFSYPNGGNTCFFKNLTGITTGPVANSSDNVAYQPANYPWVSSQWPSAAVYFATRTTTAGIVNTALTSVLGTSGTVLVVVAASTTVVGTTTVSATLDSGTASLPITTTVSAMATPNVVTVLTIYPTPITTCNNLGVRYAMYSTMPVFSTPQLLRTLAPVAYNFTWTSTTGVSTVTSSVTGTNSAGVTSLSNTTYITTTTSAVPIASNAVVPTGTATQIRVLAFANSPIPIYNVPSANSFFMVIDHTFYMYVSRGTGWYSFWFTYADDQTMIWLGPKALAGWTQNNIDLNAGWWERTLYQGVSYYLTQGTYVPVRVLYGNGYNAAILELFVSAPDGSTLVSSVPGQNVGVLSPQIVTHPCDSSFGPPFSPWGNES